MDPDTDTELCSDCKTGYIYDGSRYADLCPECDAYAHAEDLAEDRLSTYGRYA